MTVIDARFVAIAEYTELLSVLITENRVFLKGQSVWAIDDVNGTYKQGLKKGDWDWQTQLQSAATPFNALPWIIQPQASGSGGFTPFEVAITDAAYSCPGADTIITDYRLVGVANPMIYSTTMGRFLRPAELGVDPINGIVTLIGFNSMQAGDYIGVFIPSAIVTAANVLALAARVTKLELYAAPFAVAGGGLILLWNRPAAQIPAGWRPYTAYAGMVLRGRLNADPDFGTVGQTGGAKTHKIDTTDKLPQFSLFTVVDQSLTGNDHPSAIGRALTGIRSFIKYWFKTDPVGKEAYELMGSDADNVQPTLSPTSSTGKATPDDINHLDPYAIVEFIELIAP